MRSIILKGHEVQSIRNNTRTQFRRVASNQPVGQSYSTVKCRKVDSEFQWYSELGESSLFKCPIGKIGERLWVKELHCIWNRKEIVSATRTYPAETGVYYYADQGAMFQVPKWKVASRMPRWASRITLEILDIQLERLHSISAQDAYAEGFRCPQHREPHECKCVCSQFDDMWERVNGHKSLMENPWVWVITFKQVDGSVSM